MASSKQRGSRVIYTTSSARELPENVRHWLSQASNSATSSANIYDVLALLSLGRKPEAIIINIDVVDWSELDFFDLALKLSPETKIFVAGYDHQQDKIDAACSRGAKPFDTRALNETLKKSTHLNGNYTEGGLLAGSLRSSPPPLKPVQPPPSSIKATIVAEHSSAAETESPKTDRDQTLTSPVVRLVTSLEHEDHDEQQPSIPFPWSPSPNRPQRTPPTKGTQSESSSKTTAHAGNINDNLDDPDRINVQLTPDEIAALMGKSTDQKSDTYKEHKQ